MPRWQQSSSGDVVRAGTGACKWRSGSAQRHNCAGRPSAGSGRRDLVYSPDNAAVLPELLQAAGGYMVHTDFIHDVLPQTVSDNPQYPRQPSAWRYRVEARMPPAMR